MKQILTNNKYLPVLLGFLEAVRQSNYTEIETTIQLRTEKEAYRILMGLNGARRSLISAAMSNGTLVPQVCKLWIKQEGTAVLIRYDDPADQLEIRFGKDQRILDLSHLAFGEIHTSDIARIVLGTNDPDQGPPPGTDEFDPSSIE